MITASTAKYLSNLSLVEYKESSFLEYETQRVFALIQLDALMVKQKL